MRNISVILFRIWTRYNLNISLSTALVATCSAGQNRLSNFGRWHCGENLCENILNLNQSFRRSCRLKYFLSTALLAILFGKAKPFRQFW